MSGDNLIDPLDPLISDELTLPLQPDFTSFVNDNLGTAADSSDGFDAVLADLIAIVDSLEQGLILLGGADGGNLDDTFLEIAALDADSPGVDVANVTLALPDVQTNADQLGTLLSTAALPQPPTTRGTLPAGCDALLGFDTTGAALPITRSLVFNPNRTVGDQTIDSLTLDAAAATLFTVSGNCGGVIPAGGTCTLTLTLTAAGATGLHGSLTIRWHDTAGGAYTAVLCLGINTGDNLGTPTAGTPAAPAPAPVPAPPRAPVQAPFTT